MKDPRDPFVAVTPEVDPWLSLNPGILDAPTEASIFRAQVSQKLAREQAIDCAIVTEGVAYMRQQALDSVAAARVADAMPDDIPYQDRHDAGAVAVRLSDPRWQTISRYYAADAILVELRKFMRDGHGWATDSELKTLADSLAGISHMARFKVWTAQTAVGLRTWTKACLGFLYITEDK